MVVRICSDTAAVGLATFDIIKSVLESALKSNSPLSIGLSGGSVVKLLSPHLCNLKNMNWSLVHFFYCDERMVPLDSQDSNHYAYQCELFSNISIPESNIHVVNTKLPSMLLDFITLVVDAASDYQENILSHFGPQNGFPCFDILILGMGPDGHTCSLFPNHPVLYHEDFVVAPVIDSPKPPSERVTLTIPVINKAKLVIFVVCGLDKGDAVKSVLKDAENSTGPGCPCTLIQPVDGDLYWIIDQNAASKL